MSSGRSVRQVELPDTTAYAVNFSPDGEFLAVGKSNGYINLFRVGTEEITLETDIPRVRSIYTGSEVTDLAWHPYGNFISDGKKVYRTHLPSEEVSLTPPSLLSSEINPVEVGTTFTLDFSVKNITDLAGWQLEVAFNPDVLSVVEVKEVNFLKSGGGNTFFSERRY
jgi:WD40 repeat protein